MSRITPCPHCRTMQEVAEGATRWKCMKCGKSVGAGSAAPASKKTAVVLVAGLLVLFVVGAGGLAAAIGGYFLVFHKAKDGNPTVQADQKQDSNKREKDSKEPADKEKKEPAPGDKAKGDPPPEPKDKNPISDPKNKQPKGDQPAFKNPTSLVVVSLYPLKTPPTPPANLKLPFAAEHIAVTPDGSRAVAVRGGKDPKERKVLIIDLPGGNLPKEYPLPDLSIRSMVMTADGRTVFVGGLDERPNVPAKDRANIWGVAVSNGDVTSFIAGPTDEVVALAIAPDNSLLAIAEGSADGARSVLRVIDRKTGVVVFSKDKLHNGATKAIVMTPDKKFVVSAGVDGDGKSKVVTFDIAGRKQKHVFEGHAGVTESLAASSDSRLIAAAINDGDSGSIRIWDLETGAEKLAIIAKGGRKGATQVAFGPDDRTVIANFNDGTTRVFGVATGNEEGGFRGHSAAPVILALSQDGAVATAFSKELKVWRFPDSLTRLTKPKDPPFAQIVRNGQPMEIKTFGQLPDDGNFKIFERAVVERIESNSYIHFALEGTSPSQVFLQPTTSYFNEVGLKVPAGEATKIYRIGNTVAIKAKKDFKSAAVEVRLVTEGAAEITVEKLKLRYTRLPYGATFATLIKEWRFRYAPKVRYLDNAGNEVADAKGYFNTDDAFTVKARLEAGAELPILYEIRSTEKGVARAPKDIPGPRPFKNAVVTRIPGQGTALALKGEEPFRIITNTDTKAFDMDGKECPFRDVLREGCIVDGYVKPAVNGMYFLTEVRLVDLGDSKKDAKEKKTPMPKGILVKNATVMKYQYPLLTVTTDEEKSITMDVNTTSMGYDAKGKRVGLNAILKVGNKVDVRYDQKSLKELIDVRPAEPLDAPQENKKGPRQSIAPNDTARLFVIKFIHEGHHGHEEIGTRKPEVKFGDLRFLRG